MNGGGMSDLTITDDPHLPECFAVTYLKVIEAVLVLPGTDLSTTNLGKTVQITQGDCICDRLRACEQRTLHAARQAICMLKRSMWRRNEEGAVVQESVWRDDALAAIDALGTDAPDQPARRALAYDPAAKDNRP